MEEKTAQALIHQGFEDIKQWIEEAPTPEAKKYRLELALEAFTSGQSMHYYHRDQNEEYDTLI